MKLDEQTAMNQQDKNDSTATDGQFYIRAVSKKISTELPKDESIKGASMPTEKSSDNPLQSKGQKGNNLNKVLLGGLLGATLGTLAAALSNKKTIQGANLAAKGVGDAVKSVGEGVNVAAKGVGEAAKTVAEGVNQGLVNPVVDAIKDTAEGAKKSLESATDKLKQTADYVNPADQEFEPQTTYVLIPVEKERIIERTIIVESAPNVDSEESVMPEELNQPSQDYDQANQYNEQNSDFND